MTAVVLAFSGAIGSGKTTLSIAVSEALGSPRVGFGDYVRQVARDRGLGESRESLQELGASLIKAGISQFCRAVLAQADWRPGEPLVIDGIRHVEAIDVLRKLVRPSTLRLVFVTVDDPTRLSRLGEEGLLNPQQLARIDSHSTEVQVRATLQNLADLVLQGTRPPLDLVDETLAWARTWQTGESLDVGPGRAKVLGA